MLSRRALLVGGAALAAPRLLRQDEPDVAPLWRIASRHGRRFGASTSTWQIADNGYRDLHARQSRFLFTEDDLLWYRLKPTPSSPLDFRRGDAIVSFARRSGQQVLGAHLVWDQGFGHGWTHADLWNMRPARAAKVLFDTIARVAAHFREEIGTWSVVNEAVSGSAHGDHGLRRDVPWYATIGASYVATSFDVVRAHAPRARLLLNEFGFETRGRFSHDPELKRRNLLRVLDRLIGADTPIDGVGLQAHLDAEDFRSRFDGRAYSRFIEELGARGLDVLVTELDVLDDGLPADRSARDRGVADVYCRFLDAVSTTPVRDIITFGLSDRYSWLDQAYPRRDGLSRRPLPFDSRLRPVPAYHALAAGLRGTTTVSRCRGRST